MNAETLGRAALAAKSPIWLLEEKALTLMAGAIGRGLMGEEKGVIYAAGGKPQKVAGKVAVLPLYGMLDQRGSMYLDWVGGTATDQFASALDEVMADSSVKAVILDIDSPGGSVFGTPEAAQKVFDSRGAKPIIAVANSYAASAAYFIGSAADRFFVTPSGMVGSIGVYMLHVDASKFLEQAGLAVTYISAGRFKTEGNEAEPLTSEGKAYMQGLVDSMYSTFVKAVARNRGTTETRVKKDMGEGRVLDAGAARGAGMVDGIKTFEQVLQAAVKAASPTSARAETILEAFCADLGVEPRDEGLDPLIVEAELAAQDFA